VFKRCQGLSRGVQGVLCQKRLRLSREVDECKPLGGGGHSGDTAEHGNGDGDGDGNANASNNTTHTSRSGRPTFASAKMRYAAAADAAVDIAAAAASAAAAAAAAPKNTKRKQRPDVPSGAPHGRGLHSLTSQLNLRTFGTHRSR
jgi:hypothetical protein